MATLQIPVEAIEAKAREADPRKAVLTVLLFVPFVLGWLVRRVWMVLVYLWAAVVAGWQEAGRERVKGGSDE